MFLGLQILSNSVSRITETEKYVCIVKWCVCDGLSAVPCCAVEPASVTSAKNCLAGS